MIENIRLAQNCNNSIAYALEWPHVYGLSLSHCNIWTWYGPIAKEESGAGMFRLSEQFNGYHDDVIKWKHFRVAGPLCGEFTGKFPSQRPVTRSFDVYFNLRPNKRLSKQSRRRWFESPSCSLWRHCNDYLRSGRHLRQRQRNHHQRWTRQ